MQINGGGEYKRDTPGVQRVGGPAQPANQYTIKLAAFKSKAPGTAHAPVPVQSPHVGAASTAPTDMRRMSPTYRVPLAHVPPPSHTHTQNPHAAPPNAHATQTERTHVFRHVRSVGTLVRWATVTVGTLVLSTLAINAIDSIDNPQYLMLGAVFHAYDNAGDRGPCPSGMVYVDTSTGGFCIDVYEVSAGNGCLHGVPGSSNDTDANLAIQTCAPASVPEASPWVFVSRQQAELACAHAGKRLPSITEWYAAALGTPDSDAVPTNDDCNTEGNTASKTGARTRCVSSAGAHDMIGNVWEWQRETVTDGIFAGHTLPSQGYVTSIDENGVPLATDAAMPSTSYFSDFFAIDPTNTQGILRGGYWRSGTDAGVYGMNVTVPPTFQGNAVGFRCAKSVEK